MARVVDSARLLPAVMLALFALAADCDGGDETCLLICDETGDRGGPGDGGSTGACGDSGRAFFEANVLALLDDGASGAMCAACHASNHQDAYGAPDFLGASGAGAYDQLVSDVRMVGVDPGNSLLLTKGIHSGPAFSAAQAAKVEEWLHIEAEERFGDCAGAGGGNGVGSPPGKDCMEVLSEVGACMTLEDWKATGMHLIAEQPTLQAGPCYACHGSGTDGNYMTQPNTDASIALGFEGMRNPALLPRLVACSLDPGTGALVGIEPSYRWRDKGGEGGHPQYVLADEHVAALDAWFGVVHEKWKNGPCGP